MSDFKPPFGLLLWENQEKHFSPISGVLETFTSYCVYSNYCVERRGDNRRPTVTLKVKARGQRWSERPISKRTPVRDEKNQWGVAFSGSRVLNRHTGTLAAQAPAQRAARRGAHEGCPGWTGRTTRHQHHFFAARGFASFRHTTTSRPHAIPGCLARGPMPVDVSSFPLRPCPAVF